MPWKRKLQSMLIPPLRSRHRHRHGRTGHPAHLTLRDVPSGEQVTLLGYEALTPDLQQYLQAYGLLPGRTIRVLAQRPVTIVQVEQTELAFEPQIARRILVSVKKPTPSTPPTSTE